MAENPLGSAFTSYYVGQVIRLIALSFGVGVVVTVLLIATIYSAWSGEMSVPEKCAALRQLKAQYQGVTLNAEQQEMKKVMAAWYRAYCGTGTTRAMG